MFGTDESPHDRLLRERHEAYKLLGVLVNENYSVGRRSYGASLKPELRRRTFGGFDEERLELGSFRRFLEAARSAGVIDIHPAPRGPDLEATPPGKAPVAAAPIGVARSRRVRRDLWDAFVSWDEDWLRVYDTVAERAFRFPKHPVPLEPIESTSLRETVGKEPDRFIPIEPISFARQRDWMREFAASVSDPVAKSALEWALTSDRPVRDFTQALQSRNDLRVQWTIYRLVLVETVIRDWANAAGLAVEIHDAQQVEDVPEPKDSLKSSIAREDGGRTSELRQLLHAAIDRMPESELLQLRLPVGYLVQR